MVVANAPTMELTLSSNHDPLVERLQHALNALTEDIPNHAQAVLESDHDLGIATPILSDIPTSDRTDK